MFASQPLRERLPHMSDAELASLEQGDTVSAEERELVRLERERRADEAQPGSDAAPVSVAVRDIDMPFTSMVLVTVKWAVASIPAMIILLTVAILAAGLLIGFIREFR